MQSSPETMANRFWFETAYEPLRVSPDGLAFELRGPSVRVNTRKSFSAEGPVEGVSPSAKNFTRLASENMEKLARAMPAFADLQNVADLSVLAALVAADRLHEKAGWDPAWAMSGYPVPAVAVPKEAPALVNFSTRARMVLFAGGGVKLHPADDVKKREKDDQGVFQGKRQSPEAGRYARRVPVQR